MKHIKRIDEAFVPTKMPIDLGNHKWFGTIPSSDYMDRVKDYCSIIAAHELGVSEKWFSGWDRMDENIDKILLEREQEFDAIVHNSNQKGFRREYTAEIVYDSLLKGRLMALKERDWVFGGFKTK